MKLSGQDLRGLGVFLDYLGKASQNYPEFTLGRSQVHTKDGDLVGYIEWKPGTDDHNKGEYVFDGSISDSPVVDEDKPVMPMSSQWGPT